MAHVVMFYGQLRFIRSVWGQSKNFDVKIKWNCNLVGLLDHPLWLQLVKASVHSFKRFTSRLLKSSFSLSMHLLPRMNVILEFHLNAASPAARNTEQVTIAKKLVHGRIRSNNNARPPDKSTVITTRPQLAWYEMELNVHEIYINDL